jgi:pilus assembly protein CpaB
MVAARAIPAGATLIAADLKPRTLTGTTPSGAILSSAEAVGQISDRAFAANELLTGDALRSVDATGIAGRVPAGKRAFSIRVSEDDIVGGFLQSGDHVDVFATVPGSAFRAKDAQDFADRSQEILLLQNLEVLAVGENRAPGRLVQVAARTVSLSLTPTDVVRLALATRFGKVSLAVRKPGDDAMAAAATASLGDLVRLPEPSVASSSQPAADGRRPAGIPLLLGTRATFAPTGVLQ